MSIFNLHHLRTPPEFTGVGMLAEMAGVSKRLSCLNMIVGLNGKSAEISGIILVDNRDDGGISCAFQMNCTK